MMLSLTASASAEANASFSAIKEPQLEALFQGFAGVDGDGARRKWMDMPVENARLFVHPFRAFMKKYILGRRALLGRVIQSVVRWEVQGRGVLYRHVHSFAPGTIAVHARKALKQGFKLCHFNPSCCAELHHQAQVSMR